MTHQENVSGVRRHEADERGTHNGVRTRQLLMMHPMTYHLSCGPNFDLLSFPVIL